MAKLRVSLLSDYYYMHGTGYWQGVDLFSTVNVTALWSQQ
jgi:hypothetical protein